MFCRGAEKLFAAHVRPGCQEAQNFCYTVNAAMDIEEIGRRIDEELTKLRRYIENEVAPETERRSAEFLREVSVKLNEAAAKLEARMAARRNTTSQNPPSQNPGS